MGYIEDLRALVGHRPLILAGAVAIVLDQQGRVLLQQRKQPHGVWGIPGGLMELGESIEDTARREVYEETQLKLGQLKLIDVYSGPQNYIKAPNGDEFYMVTVAFYTDEVEGELQVNKEEAITFQYFNLNALPETIVKTHQTMLNDYIERFR